MASEADQTFVQAICNINMNDPKGLGKFLTGCLQKEIKPNYLGKDDVCQYWICAIPELVYSEDMAAFSKYACSDFSIYAWCVGQITYARLGNAGAQPQPCGYYVLYENPTGSTTSPTNASAQEHCFWLMPSIMIDDGDDDWRGEDVHMELPRDSILYSQDNRECYKIKATEILDGLTESGVIFGEKKGCYEFEQSMVRM